MCINCKGRFHQDELHRFQCVARTLRHFSGEGRSFYICSTCLEDSKLAKSLARICKQDPASALKMLKEIVENG